jgi:hypothetical protein
MKKITSCLLGTTLLCAGLNLAASQEKSDGVTPPPKVLTIFREFLKPGKGGAAHERAESAFVQAMTKAKWPTHYFAANSLSGKSRTIFLTGYDSFEAWEKDALAVQKNVVLSAALDRAALNDGELLSETDATVLIYDEDQSLRGPVDIAHMRYFEVSLFRVRPGHRGEWAEIVKLVKAAYEKIPDAHWALYSAAYGQEGATYAVFIPMKSASEIDRSFAQDKDFVAAMGEDGMKKLGELESSAIEFSQTNLFQFSPKMSYPPDAWVKADPDFWKPKAEAAAKAPKAEEKPASKP